jgi:hypothetical protein
MNTKIGTQVKQIVPAAIVGTIMEVRWNQDADCKEILVQYTENGEPHSRWFLESELMEPEAPAA